MDRSALLESATRLDGRKPLVLFAVVVATILIDSEVALVSDFISEKISSSAGISLFVCTAVIFAISGFFILSYVKQIGKESGATILHLNRTHKLVTVVQYVLVAKIAFVVLQIVITLQYNTFSLALTISISYGLWIMTMALLARAFYSWYKSIAHQSESPEQNLNFDTRIFDGSLRY
jgi:hypothetical protein